MEYHKERHVLNKRIVASMAKQLIKSLITSFVGTKIIQGVGHWGHPAAICTTVKLNLIIDADNISIKTMVVK